MAGGVISRRSTDPSLRIACYSAYLTRRDLCYRKDDTFGRVVLKISFATN